MPKNSCMYVVHGWVLVLNSELFIVLEKVLLLRESVEAELQVITCHMLPADLRCLESEVFLVLGPSQHKVVPVLPGLVHP